MLGLMSLLGIPGFVVREPYEVPHNFQWKKLWEGSGTGVNGFVTALYSVIWYNFTVSLALSSYCV